MTVELISVGTELLLGNITNTNASYLARKLAVLGLSSYYQVTVGDNEDRVMGAVKTALNRSDVVILTGGLGPTEDDMTKEAVAKVLGRNLVTDEHSKIRVKKYFDQIGKTEITENNWKQAVVIEGSEVVDNEHGLAPGMIISEGEKKLILLPGPPNEMVPMFEGRIIKFLSELQPNVIYSTMVKLTGIGESKAETMIRDLIDEQSNPTIATYAKVGEVHIRVTASAPTKGEAKDLVKPVVKELKHRFKENVFTTNERENLEDVVVKLLNKYDLTITTAESCTGGMFTGRIVNVSGVSDVLKEGFITYSNKAKRKYLDVNKSTLKKYTAVSEQTAKEMAKGAAIGTNADVSVAITGLAGPGGGSDDIPVGTVYIGCYVNEHVTVKEYHFSGDRQKVREQAVISALDLLRRCIIQNYK